ncbi:MAG TPA: hypothetical protein VHF24_07005 [Acidimicrobiales bacterium]|nr:hypothetical protein [Acidimicrobiales bacterium]
MAAPLVGILAAVLLAAGLATVAIRSTSEDRPAATAPGVQPAPPEVAAPTTTATTRPLPPEPAFVAEIRAAVARLRGLEWRAPLAVEVVSRSELVRRARAANERDRRPDRLAGDGDTYRLLKAIPRGLDYVRALDDLISGLILGFYDPKTKELVVRDGGGEVDAQTKVTVAHELDHALTDQHFDFGAKTDALDQADRQEEVEAYVALIEGDAKLLEERYAEEYLTEEEQVEYVLGPLAASEEDLTPIRRLPPFMLGELYFPYTVGLDFAEDRADDGDFAALNEAFRRPPVSTEQVIHPERYAAGQGWAPPPLPDVAAATSCQAVRRGTLGESTMGLVLDTYLDEAGAKAAANGWNGDTFQTVRCGRALGMVERWEADSPADAARLAQALTRWAAGWAGSAVSGGRFSGRGGAGRIVHQGTRVDLVLADDAATADRLSGVI